MTVTTRPQPTSTRGRSAQLGSDRSTWQAVQRRRDVVEVRSVDPIDPAHLPAGHALVRVVAAGICGADVRVVTGNKACAGDPDRATTLGHEAVGVVEAVGSDHDGALRPGTHVFVLPHLLPDGEPSSTAVDVRRIGAAGTRHMGWDVDGVFADRVVAPTTHLIPIADAYLDQSRMFVPDLGEAVFAFTEPMLCTLSSYELIRRQEQTLQRPLLRPGGTALVLGCGPIGILHATALGDLGYEVALYDPEPARPQLAQWCLGSGRSLGEFRNEQFDVVVAAASSLAAIRMGERRVRDGGLLYLFAGLNTAERESMDDTRTFSYERLHRIAKAVVTTVSVDGHDKPIVYLGHSGYYDHLAPQAIATVAAHATTLGRAITGVIPGWSPPAVLGRGPWSDRPAGWGDEPALLAALNGANGRQGHMKLIVRPASG